MKLGSRYM